MKKKLIDIDKTQSWLVSQVNEKTGLRSDVQYINRVIRGERKSARITNAISEILGIAI